MGQKIKKMLNSEKGSITVLVVAAMLFMIVILVLSFMGMSNKTSTQMSNIKQIEKEYASEEDIGQVYKETIETIDRVGDIKITPSTTEWTNGDVTVTIEYQKQLTENRKAGIGSADTPNATSLTLTENGTVYAEAYTKDGHRRKASLQINNIDKVKPTAIIRTNGGSYVMPTKSDKATIKTRVNVNDLGGSELKDIKYAWSQSKDVEPTSWQTFADGDTVTKNDCTIGTYYLWLNVTDNAGNRADTKVSNAFIVRDSSNAMDNITFKVEPDGWTNKDVKVTVIYGDNLTENRKAGPEGEDLKPNATTVTMTENGKVVAEAEDPAGNKVIAEIVIDKIDKVAPVIKTVTNPSNGNWTNQNVTVTLVAEDNLSGIKEFQWFENGEWTTRALETNGNTGTITYTAERDTTIRFRVIDNAGNISEEKTTVVKIDKTAPTHTRAEVKNITTTGYDVYVYGVTDGTGSGVNRVQFPTWTEANGQDDLQSEWRTNSNATGVKQVDGTTWVYHVNVTDHKNEYGSYMTDIYGYDNIGNEGYIGRVKVEVPGVVITLNANGGSVSTGTLTKGYGSQMGTLPTPTRTGYTFTGWFTAATGGTKITSTTTVPANNVTYYAQWTINNYTVTYDNNYYANSIWNDTTLLGKYAQAGTTPKSKTNVADANAKDGNYIKFVMPAGTSGGPYYVPAAKLTAGKTYTWSVYVKASTNKTIFMGDEQNGQKTVNLTTNWQKVTHTFTATDRNYIAFTFYANYGGWADGEELYVHSLEIMEGTPTHTTANKQYNSALGTLPAPTRTGYTFTGWYTAPVGGTKISDATTVPANNVTYYAHWTTNTYTITYNLNGGTANGPTSFNVGTETITLPTPTKNGYTFTGWTGSNGTTPQKTVTIPKGSTGNKSYTANWTATNYTITYNLNGGAITGQPTSYNIESNEITLPTPTRTGYTFTGWTGSNGTTPQTTVKIAKGSTGNKTYTANWTATNYTITYNLNGGTITGQPTSYNIESNEITLPTPTRTGYTFTGWTGSNGTTSQTTVKIPKGSTGNKTYTANWSINSYKIDLNLHVDGTDYYSGYNSRVKVGLKIGGVDKGYVQDYGGNHQYGTTWEMYGLELDGEKVAYSRTGTLGAQNTSIWADLNTITFKVNNASYGTVSVANRLVASGTTYSTSGATVTLAGGRKVTATATNATGHTTVLSSWSPASGTVNAATTVTANFTRTANDYTLTVNPNGGTWGGKTTNSTVTQKYNTTKSLGNATPPAGYAVTFNGNGGTSAQGSITSTKSFSSWTKSGSGSYIPSVANPSTGGMTMTKKTDTDGMAYYNYAYNVSGITGNTWYWSRFPAYAYTAGSTYEIRFKVRVNSSSGGDITFRHAALVNDYGTPGWVSKGFSTATSGWQDVTMTRTFTGTTTTLNNNTVTIAPVFEFYTGNLMNRNAAINFDVKDIQIINTSTGAIVQSSNNSYLYGAGAGTVTANYTNNAITLPNATRTGYTFNGWYTAASGGTKVGNAGAQWTPTAATTLYAQWTRDNYTITYNLNGGSISGQTTNYNVESNAITLPTPTRTGYTFTGWTGSNGTTAQTTVTIPKGSTGNKTYTANWKINQYTIDLNMNVDGTLYGSGYNSRVTVGFKVGGVDKGYVQDYCAANNYGTSWEIYGLKLDGEAVAYTASGTLGAGNAGVVVNLNTITFKANNASYGTVSASSRIVVRGTTYSTSGSTVTLAGGRKVTAAITNATGYTTTFSSWSPASGTVNAATTVTANFARTGIVSTITLNGQSATSAGSTAVYQKYGSGVYKEVACTNQMTASANAITKPSRSYTLTYNANGGTVSPASTTASYTFGGYYTATGGGGDQLINANGNITDKFTTTKYSANATLYAKWTRNAITLATPTRAGYTFKGWFTAASGGTQITSATSITANQTIYAQWQLSICNVHFDLNTMNNMNNWAFIYKERFNISYDAASKLNTVVVNGSDGWEVAYIPFNTIVGKEYTISFDYQNPNGYNALSGYQGIGYQVLTSVGNQDNLSASVATKYLATGKTGVTRLSITFKATTATTYFAYNFGMAADGVTTTLKLGNLRISETVSYNTAIGKLPTPIRTGYTFNGWYTAASGGTKIEETTKATVENITYYLQWQLTNYTITYNLNSGTVTGNPTSYNIETNTITLKNPTRANHIFNGWTGSNGTTAQTTVTIPKGSTGNKSYTANWTAANYSVNTNPVTYYMTLAQAVAASSNGSTITLLKDCTDTSGVSINKTLTFNKNGHTLTRSAGIVLAANTTATLTVTGTGTITSSSNAIINNGTGSVIINGGEIKGTGTVSTINNGSTGKVEVKSGTVSSSNGTVIHNETRGTILISGGTVSATGTTLDHRAIYNKAAGSVTVTSGTIKTTQGRGIYNKSSDAVVNIQSGTFNTGAECVYMENGTLWIDTATMNAWASAIYFGPAGNLRISGGSYTSTAYNGLHVNGGAVTITGGTFTGKENGIYMEGASRVTAYGGTYIGTGTNSAIKAMNTSTSEFIDPTFRTSGTYLISNETGSGNGCIIRSRASNFGLSGNNVYGYVIATTNNSVGQSSELVRIYNAATTYVMFPTWTDRNGQDDIKWYNTSKNGNYNEVRIYKSNHNNETGRYNVHIYDSVTSGTARNIIGTTHIDI